MALGGGGVLDLLGDRVALLARLVEKNTSSLGSTDAEEEEVDGSKAAVDSVSGMFLLLI